MCTALKDLQQCWVMCQRGPRQHLQRFGKAAGRAGHARTAAHSGIHPLMLFTLPRFVSLQTAHRPRKFVITITLDSAGHLAAASTNVNGGDRSGVAANERTTTPRVNRVQLQQHKPSGEDASFLQRVQQR